MSERIHKLMDETEPFKSDGNLQSDNTDENRRRLDTIADLNEGWSQIYSRDLLFHDTFKSYSASPASSGPAVGTPAPLFGDLFAELPHIDARLRVILLS